MRLRRYRRTGPALTASAVAVARAPERRTDLVPDQPAVTTTSEQRLQGRRIGASTITRRVYDLEPAKGVSVPKTRIDRGDRRSSRPVRRPHRPVARARPRGSGGSRPPRALPLGRRGRPGGHGKAVGAYAPSVASAIALLELGCTFVACPSDAGLLAAAAREAVRSFRALTHEN